MKTLVRKILHEILWRVARMISPRSNPRPGNDTRLPTRRDVQMLLPGIVTQREWKD